MLDKPESRWEVFGSLAERSPGKWFYKVVKLPRFYCSETFYDWYPGKIVNRVTFSSNQKSVNIANLSSQGNTDIPDLCCLGRTAVRTTLHQWRSVRTDYHKLWNKNSNKFHYEVSLDFGIWTVLTMIVLFVNPISSFVMRYTITDPAHVTSMH